MPEISVIIPVFNVEQRLEECLSSVLAQTYTDFEVVLVDDGSTDNSAEICDRYAEKDPRIRTVHQSNQGAAAARNNGVRLSCGEWICFVDSDDMIHQDMLKVLFEAVQESGIRISACGFICADEIDGSFFTPSIPVFRTVCIDEDELFSLSSGNSSTYWCIWAKIIHRSIIEKYPLTEGRIYEDNAVMCQWLIEAGKISLTDSQFYFYHRNQLGVSLTSSGIKKLDYLWALQEQIRIYKNSHFSRMEEEFAKRYLVAAKWMYGLLDRGSDSRMPAKMILDDMQAAYSRYKDRIEWDRGERKDIRSFIILEKHHLYWIKRLADRIKRVLSRVLSAGRPS